MRISFCSCHQAQLAIFDTGAPSTLAPASGGAYPAQLREDIAIGNRICAAENVFDAFGHLSVRHPSAPDRFLMTKSLAPALARPGDVVELDLDGRACGDENRPLFLERFIHGEIYKIRPDVNAIVHSHSPSVIPFSLVDNPMRAMFHTAAFIAAGVPVFDIAERFGDTDMLVSNHVMKLLSTSVVIGRPIFAGPGVPAERVTALRRAFDATVRDGDFIREAREAKMDLDPVSGEELQKLVSEIVATPKHIADRLTDIIGGGQ